MFCGDDISSRSCDRRLLDGPSSIDVLNIWKELFKERLEEIGILVDINELVTGGKDPQKAGRMCRKCFSAFDRFRKLRLSITKNLEDVLEVLLPDVEIPVPKRLCQQQADEGPTSSVSKPCFVFPGVGHSPIGTVSLLYKYN